MRFSKDVQAYAKELYERQSLCKKASYNLDEIVLLLKERFEKGPSSKTILKWAKEFKWKRAKKQNSTIKASITILHEEIHRNCLNLIKKRLDGQIQPDFDLKDLISLYEKTFKNLNLLKNPSSDEDEKLNIQFISPKWLKVNGNYN